MELVNCIDLYEKIYQAPVDAVILRPAAYAIVLRAGRILLLKMKATGKYHLPGGRIEADERIEDTLKRELREETGLSIEVGRLAHFEEVFFYYNPSERAYHGLHFYYLCSARGSKSVERHAVQDGSAEKPAWVDIEGLAEDQFQTLGGKVLEICRRENHQSWR